ncbi:MAG: hypothetical protein INH43_27350 [Acidobacteriaceae bacterium]|nr:hypothetical protein [Acidobacteriaceae bacterium]
MSQDILTVEESVFRVHPTRGTLPGALLTMRDGSVWWHPYTGAPPVKERDAD